jgi:hypothetical protein
VVNKEPRIDEKTPALKQVSDNEKKSESDISKAETEKPIPPIRKDPRQMLPVRIFISWFL